MNPIIFLLLNFVTDIHSFGIQLATSYKSEV